MNHLFQLSAAFATVLALSGCGTRQFSARTTNPVIEDRVRAGDSSDPKMSIVSTRADRRTILLFGPNRICAEPAPDVGEAVSGQVIAELATLSKSVGFGQSSATAIMALVNRSQGLQYYRDGLFALCIMRENGVISDNKEYLDQHRYLFDQSVRMTMAQIEKNALPPVAGTVAAPVPPSANPDTLQPVHKTTSTTTTSTESVPKK